MLNFLQVFGGGGGGAVRILNHGTNGDCFLRRYNAFWQFYFYALCCRGKLGEETTNYDERPRRKESSESKRFQRVARWQEYDEFNGEVSRKVYWRSAVRSVAVTNAQHSPVRIWLSVDVYLSVYECHNLLLGGAEALFACCVLNTADSCVLIFARISCISCGDELLQFWSVVKWTNRYDGW